MTLKPRDGDRPAIEFKSKANGLHVLAHETKMKRLTYKEWAKWQKFIKHKDLTAAAANHDARGLPRENFKEGYFRNAKALIAVGNGEGKDTRMGLSTEFVALTNPLAQGYGGTMRAQLFYEGKPRKNAQVEVFERLKGGGLNVSVIRTDNSGVVTFKTRSGSRYLIDSVLLREPRTSDKNIAWETLWASMTFAHP